MKFNKLLKTGLVFALSLSFLTGCQSEKTVKYTRSDTLTISTGDGENDNAQIPYNEVIAFTLNKDGSKAVSVVDDICYELSDKYFTENENQKEALKTNLENGLSSVFVDKGEGALVVNVSLKNDKINAVINADFAKLEDVTLTGQLFGVSVEDFDEDKAILLETLDASLLSAGFEKSK